MNYFRNKDGVIPFDKVVRVHVSDGKACVTAGAPESWDYFPMEQFENYIEWLEKIEKAEALGMVMDTFAQEALAVQKQGIELQKTSVEVNKDHLEVFRDASMQKYTPSGFVDIGNGEVLSYEMIEFIKTLVKKGD